MLSLEDQLAIQALYARYNHAIDLGTPEAYAECFVSDGVVALEGMIEHAGREALMAMAVASKTRGTTRHWNANLVLAGDGETATGVCYLMLYNTAIEPAVLLRVGVYRDQLVKRDGRWLFVRRVLAPDRE